MNGLQRRFGLGFLSLLFAVSVTGDLLAETRTWVGPDGGNWDHNMNWSDNLQPFGGDSAVVGGNPLVNTLEQFLNLTNTGSIQITGGSLEPAGGSVENDGVVTIGDGSTAVSQFFIKNLSTLSGSGEVVLKNSDNTGNSNSTLRGSSDPSNPTTHVSGHTIRGEGSMIQNWVNDSTIRAEETTGDSTATLRIGNATAFQNNATIQSSPTGLLELSGVTMSFGAAGDLLADTSPVYFSGSNTLNGGSLEASTGGVFQMLSAFTKLSGVTVNAPLNVAPPVLGATLQLDAVGFTNNNVITFDPTPSNTVSLSVTQAGTIGGPGEVVFKHDTRTSVTGFPQLTNGAGHTIRGVTQIQTPLKNLGTIAAQAFTGTTFQLWADVENEGLMRADAGATLRFNGPADVVQTASGVIRAEDGGVVHLVGNTLTGGSFETAGAGSIDAIELSTISGVTNNGAIGVLKTLVVTGPTFTNNGVVNVNKTAAVAFTTLRFTEDTTLNGTGDVHLNESGINFPSNLEVAAGKTVTQAAGHTIRGSGSLLGRLVNEGLIRGDSAAEPSRVLGWLGGDGTLRDVAITSNLFYRGTHAPGDTATGAGTAVVPLEGDYSIPSTIATLRMDLGGTTPGAEHDQLSSTGTVSLGGVLDVDLTAGYLPTAGDRFTIVSSPANPITGTFVQTLLPTNIANYAIAWTPVEYNTNDVTLEVAAVTALPGDYNADGTVDAADYAVWRNTVGTMGVPLYAGADGNGDGDITTADYDVWRQHYGDTAPGLVAAQTAPEPTAIVLLFLLTVACGYRTPLVCRTFASRLTSA